MSLSPKLTKIMYLDYSYINYKTRLYLKNIDYNIRYAYSIYLPNNFASYHYLNADFSFAYKPSIDLHDNYLLIYHDLQSVPTYMGSFTNFYEVFNFNGKINIINIYQANSTTN